MPSTRLAVLSTHPIQYQVPWFRALSKQPSIQLEVLYCHKATAAEQGAAGFGRDFDWDVPLLNGYEYRFLKNEASQPTISSFKGLNTPEIATLISSSRYDALLVHGWHYRSAWQAFRACWKARIPLLVRGDSQLLTPRSALKTIMKKATYPAFISRFDACLAVGTRSREYFLHYGALPQKVFLVPHVIDEEMYERQLPPLEERRTQLRTEWNLKDSLVVFAFVGKFLPVKRPMDFIRAVERASSSSSDVAAIMVGDGPLRATCEEYARSRHVPIRFVGFLNQSLIMKAYVVSDALVLPSESETWGIVVNEAMRCGRPCFVSDQVGSAPDMIEPGVTGETFPAGDVDALAGMMLHFAQRPADWISMRAGSRNHSIKFSVSCAVDGVLNALDAVQSDFGAKGRSC